MKGKNFPIQEALLGGITGELSPEQRIRSALAGGRRKTGEQLRSETGLGREFYAVAGPMYERRELRTNGDGVYWLEDRR